MSEETLSRIFDPFFTTKFQGRGLGLAAARGIVDKFDGALGVWSEEGSGSEFLLALPLSVSAEVEEEKPAQAPAGGRIQGGGLVWIVDDEPLICDTMSRFVTRWGLECRTDTNSTEAISHIKEAGSRVDCLVLDVTMPGMDGEEVLREIRKTLPDLPVLLMSGFDEQEMLKRFEGHTIAGFIHKPFQADALFNRLRQVLESDASSS
jgi:CheY-like chemotaxis protein